MITTTVQIPMTPEDIAELRAKQLAEAETRHRERQAKLNRAKGLPEPTVGTRLHVMTARGIKQRSRAGLAFTATSRVEVEVVAGTDEEVAKRQGHGQLVVNADGAERILADDGLVATTDANLVNAQQELARAQALIAELEGKLLVDREKAAAEAMRAAPESPDGRPTRLPAADKVRKTTPGGGDFGGDDKGKA